MAEVLGTGRLPNNVFGVLSAQFRVTDADRGSPPIELQEGWGIHAFLGRITTEAAPVPGLAGITLLGVYRDGGSHILHSFFSAQFRPYDMNRWLFRCRGKLSFQGIPAITEIPVTSFAARSVIRDVQHEYHIVDPGTPTPRGGTPRKISAVHPFPKGGPS